MFVYVCLGTELGLVIKPNSGGLEPRWTSELKIAKFSWFCFDIVPIRFAGLNPVTLFIKFSLETLSNLSIISFAPDSSEATCLLNTGLSSLKHIEKKIPKK